MGSLLLAIIYISFISLGLPDSLLGSAWPVLRAELEVPTSFAGIISMTIFVGTILSSLLSDRLLRKFGAGKITAFSTVLTAVGLLGFFASSRFWMFVLWAIPYGLGAGCVDAVLNNYVAVHYKPQHMSWLHCTWGVGATISPYIMSYSLFRFNDWNQAYLIVAIVQAIMAIFIFISIPIWDKGTEKQKQSEHKDVAAPLSFKEIFGIKGALPCFWITFAYCAIELTTALWLSSYLVEEWTITPELAAGFAGMFYIGITLGRFINGFLVMKFNDQFLIRVGLGIMVVGIGLLFMPFHVNLALIGFILVGLGGAPIYPCIIHMMPEIFGEDKSQALIGVEMAFAYTGFLIMPPLFGALADCISISLLPGFLLVLTLVMFVMHEIVVRISSEKDKR